MQSVFEQLDRKRVGYIAIPDIVSAHNASRHPSVMFGEQTANQVQESFLASFRAATSHTGASFVNLFQWMEYFHYVSGHAPSDEYFDLLMKRVWGGTTKTSLANATAIMPTNLQSPATIAPVSLLDALSDNKFGLNSQNGPALSISTALPPPVPSRLHRTNSNNSVTSSFSSSDGVSPRATHTTTEFLKGSQFAACMVDPSIRQPSSSHSKRLNSSSTSSASSAAASIDAGTISVLHRLRTTIKERGLRSLVELCRHIRLSDVDGDSLLSLPEFKNAVKTEVLQLSDVDLRWLFRHLDQLHRGLISLQDVLDLIREPMNARRLALVRIAFQSLDRSETSSPQQVLLDPSEIVQAYDASRHPDVIAGRKREDDVFHEFVENFDVEDQSSGSPDTQGKISLYQWEQYYHNVSFFIADDDFFELMICNTWQLDASRVMPCLPPSEPTTKSAAQAPAAGRPSPVPSDTVRIIRGSGLSSHQAFSILQPDLDLDRSTNGRSAPAPGQSQQSQPQPSSCVYSAHKQSKELRRIIHQLRSALKDQGVVGFISLQRIFRLMDEDQNGSINLTEFQRALKESKLHLSSSDVQNLFYFFDSNHDGSIDFTEFMLGIREPMNERRMLFVRMAFDIIDKDHNGVLEVNDIIDVYDARKHPEVISGRKTEQEVFTEFIETFDIDHLHDGKVSFDQWSRYYANISASIDDDDYFELMMRNAWHITGGHGWCANTSNRRVLVTHADGHTSVEEVKNDIGVKREDVARVLTQQLGAKPINVSVADALNNTTPRLSSSPAHIMARRANINTSQSMAACLSSPSDPKNRATASSASSSRRGSLQPSTPGTENHPAGVQSIISKLKEYLKAEGISGFCGLSRRFRLIDEDGNGSLNLSEFRKAMSAGDLLLSDADIRLLFEYFDTDHSGSIDRQEFLVGVRDPMNERRLFFVGEAFKCMDKDGNGLLEPSDIVEAYDASRHPDVLSGRRTPDDVCREFLETFDVDGIHNGKITWTQWIHYYANVSASIDDDDYFELMMRNAWHISGGTGWCANTTNRRVLVTLSDGTDVVREVKNDLGVKLQDVAARLQAQDTMEVKTGHQSVGASPAISTGYANTFAPPSNGKKIISLKEASCGAPMELASGAQSVTSSGMSSYGDSFFHTIRHRLGKKTLSDIVQFRKRALQYIDAKTGTISAQQCSSCLSFVLGLSLTEEHCTALLTYLQADSINSAMSTASIGSRILMQQQRQTVSDRILLDRLFSSLLGTLSPASNAVCSRVFASLQNASKGRVFPVGLAKSFQAGNHPDVRLGLATREQVFQEFAQNFEFSGSTDGAITWEHFETYCVNLRATLASDDHLHVLMRDCFEISNRS